MDARPRFSVATALRRCLMAATLVVACVDGPTSPGVFGELRIRPSYPALDSPSELGLDVDSASVLIARLGSGSLPVVDGNVAYSADTQSLGWLLELLAEEEQMEVEISVWDEGVRVYEGSEVTIVRDGSTAAALVASIPMTYVGPPIADTVIVTPDSLFFDALSASNTVSGEVLDRHGARVETPIAWSVEDGSVAAVDPATGEVTAVGNGSSVLRASAGAASSAVVVEVAQRVTSVEIVPEADTLTRLEESRQFSAVARDRLSQAVESAVLTWSSSAPSVVSVDATGLVTAQAGGEAIITAVSGTASASAVVTVAPVQDVARVEITPAAATLSAVGATQAFGAVAYDAEGTALSGVPFTWSADDASVATVNAASGLATATGHGETRVTATANGVSGTATLTVSLTQTVSSVEVLPDGATLDAVGATQQFTAVARDANGVDVPGIAFVWASTNEAAATVDPATGLATATGHGEATISASANGVSGSAALTVTLTQTVASVVVSPATASLDALGATQLFSAVALDADGVPVPGIAFSWTSAQNAVGTVDPATGLATATGHGETSISATANGVSGSATLTVELTQTVTSIEVLPDEVTLDAVGAAQQFTAVARDANGVEVPGIAFDWASTNEAAATVDPATGLATATGHGETSISASANGVGGSAALTVTLTQTVASVVVSPATASLDALGATQQFSAVALDADGVPVPGIAFVWTSTNEAAATVNPATGLATATGHGETTISASANGVSGSIALTVDLSAQVASLTVTPAKFTLTALDATVTFTAEARDSDGVLLPGVPVAWSSGTPTVATIDPVTGVATAVANGETEVIASANGVVGTTTLFVQQQAARVEVTPADVTVAGIGSSQQFSAQAFDANGYAISDATFDWRSLDESIATVDAAGVATALAVGSVEIKAYVNGVFGVALLIVP